MVSCRLQTRMGCFPRVRAACSRPRLRGYPGEAAAWFEVEKALLLRCQWVPLALPCLQRDGVCEIMC